jgi:hypothetical protein
VALCGCYAPSPPTGTPCVIDTDCAGGLVCSPASMTCERTRIDAAVVVDAVDAAIDAPVGIDAAKPFLYRRRITISNASGSTLPAGFTIRVPLPILSTLVLDGKVRSDFADLRVIGDGSIGERDRVIDPPNAPAPVGVSFALAAPIAAGATSSSYALYYGAPQAGAAPANGKNVFPVFDDFTSGISTTWLVNDAPTTGTGRLVLRAGRTDALTTSAASDGVPIVSAVEVMARAIDPQSDPTMQPEGTFWYWWGYQRSGDFTAGQPWIVWIARGKGVVKTEQNSPVGCEMNCPGTELTQNTAMHYYAIERDPGATRFYRDGALATTTTVTNSTDYAVIVRNYMATSAVEIDYVRARARVSPDPSVTFGAEEAL